LGFSLCPFLASFQAALNMLNTPAARNTLEMPSALSHQLTTAITETRETISHHSNPGLPEFTTVTRVPWDGCCG
ncbi:hypothetical protein, partial [Pseudomonas aeruginosa]|uniref:hypothetical protein n=1 Tax=Pseudomonas aeruginosa TaxID=287 RepID=UPI003F528CF9